MLWRRGRLALFRKGFQYTSASDPLLSPPFYWACKHVWHFWMTTTATTTRLLASSESGQIFFLSFFFFFCFKGHQQERRESESCVGLLTGLHHSIAPLFLFRFRSKTIAEVYRRSPPSSFVCCRRLVQGSAIRERERELLTCGNRCRIVGDLFHSSSAAVFFCFKSYVRSPSFLLFS